MLQGTVDQRIKKGYALAYPFQYNKNDFFDPISSMFSGN